MARIIEFHIPSGFNPTRKYVPRGERGALSVFPPNLTRSASDAPALNSEMIQPMTSQPMELAVVFWRPQ
jgi:hypothetical protein